MSTRKLTAKRLITILGKIPEKKFRIAELAPLLIDKDGKVDIAKCIDQQGEINLAIVELQTYIKKVRVAGYNLSHISGNAADPDDEAAIEEEEELLDEEFAGEGGE